jgi:TatD DNase family protein
MSFLGIDVHCHIINCPETLHHTKDIQTENFILMTCKREDWSKVTEFHVEHLIAFGIHPWFTHLHNESDLEEMSEFLSKFPDALVGEIGLDKVASNPETGEVYPYGQQLEFFKKQMELATKFNRAVSIHCVHTHGDILHYFRDLDQKCKAFKKDGLELPCPPKIMLHSYSGSSEIANSLLKLPRIGNRFYFSFSHIVNSRSPKSLSRIRDIPDDRILLESDVHCSLKVNSAMEDIILLVSKAKGWTREYTIGKTTKNAFNFIKRIRF